MHDQLTDQILYGKYQIKYLEEEIIQEQRYRQRARREERNNHRRLMIFSALTILLGFGLLFLVLWELFFAEKSPSLALPISLLILLPIQFFMAVFLVLSIFRLVKYAKRIHGDVDWKTFTYKRYADMQEDSLVREKYLHQELLRTQMTYQNDLERLEERKTHVVPQEMKVIGMEELRMIREEGKAQPQEMNDANNMGRLIDAGEAEEST